VRQVLDSAMETQPHEQLTQQDLAGQVRTPSPDLTGEQHIPLTPTVADAFAMLEADYNTAEAKVCSGWLHTQAVESWLLCMNTLLVNKTLLTSILRPRCWQINDLSVGARYLAQPRSSMLECILLTYARSWHCLPGQHQGPVSRNYAGVRHVTATELYFLSSRLSHTQPMVPATRMMHVQAAP